MLKSSVVELVSIVENIVLRNKVVSKEILGVEDYRQYKRIKERKANKLNSEVSMPNVSKSLIEKLHQLVLAFTPSQYSFSAEERLHVTLLRKHTVARILLALGSKNHAIALYQDIYEKAKKVEEVNLLFCSTRRLFYYYSSKGNRPRLAKKYYKECSHYLEIQQNEINLEHLFYEDTGRFVKSKYISQDLKSQIQKNWKYINQMFDQNQSKRFYYFYYIYGILYYESRRMFDEIPVLMATAIDHFEKKFLSNRTQILNFRYQKCNYLLKLDKLETIPQEIDLVQKNAIRGGSHWQRSNEILCVYYLRTLQLESAIQHLSKMFSKRYLRGYSKRYTQRIELIKNYLYLYLMIIDYPEKPYKHLRVGKFMNSVPEFDADKKAMNISIIILQIMYFIIQKKHDKLEDRFESIDKYLSRNLKSDKKYRSHCFIKMLMQVHRSRFHPVAMRRNANKYYKLLLSTPIPDCPQPIEIEYLRYEDLWEGLIMFFQKQRERKRNRN